MRNLMLQIWALSMKRIMTKQAIFVMAILLTMSVVGCTADPLTSSISLGTKEPTSCLSMAQEQDLAQREGQMESQIEAQRDAQVASQVHILLHVTLFIFLMIISILWFRAWTNNRKLMTQNRSLYDQIQRLEIERKVRPTSHPAQPKETLSAEQQLYRRLCTLMEEKQPYTDENLNRETLAQLLGTNAKYVVQAIHECSHGETVSDFITRYRLEHVAELLSASEQPISLVGELSGIPSRATLARLFRQTYGMTCSEYRQATQKHE